MEWSSSSRLFGIIHPHIPPSTRAHVKNLSPNESQAFVKFITRQKSVAFGIGARGNMVRTYYLPLASAIYLGR